MCGSDYVGDSRDVKLQECTTINITASSKRCDAPTSSTRSGAALNRIIRMSPSGERSDFYTAPGIPQRAKTVLLCGEITRSLDVQHTSSKEIQMFPIYFFTNIQGKKHYIQNFKYKVFNRALHISDAFSTIHTHTK